MSSLFIDSGKGLLIYLKYLLKDNIKGKYYFYFDEENFPYGNKNDEELYLILKDKIRLAYLLKCNHLFIACNTLSTIYLKNKFDTKLKIDNVLDVNLTHMLPNYYYLGTKVTYEYLKSKNVKVINAYELASYIEHLDIYKIIKYIKNNNLPHNLILSCTHYPLIKELLYRYKHISALSFEEEYLLSLKKKEKQEIHIISSNVNYYKKLFYNSNIFYIDKSYFLMRDKI